MSLWTKVKNNTLRRLVSMMLVFIIVLGVVPLDLVYAQNQPKIKEINFYRTFESLSDIGTYGVAVSGEGLSGVTISYKEEATDEFIPLTNPSLGSDDTFRQFRLDAGIIISQLRVGNKKFDINEGDMPKISEIEPKQFDTESEDGGITFKGKNFDNFGAGDDPSKPSVAIKISNNDLTGDFADHENNEVTLTRERLAELLNGIKHITIEKKAIEQGVNITTTYNQRNAFRLYKSINLDEDDVIIHPNRGKVGTPVNIIMKNHKEKYSVFFLEDETKPFMYENMGEDPRYSQTTDNDGRIEVKVPKGLTTGKTYKVVITNKLDSIKKESGKDLTSYVTAQKTIGEFYVVGADVGPSIIKADPSSGTNAGAYVTIYGYRFEELKISGLQGVDDVVTKDELDIISAGEDEPTRLRINYKVGKDAKYNGNEVKSVTRDFLVTIGRDALFEEDHLSEQVFEKGDDKEDALYVKTKTIEEVGKEDVVIQMDTVITTVYGDEDKNEEEFAFTEVAILPNGYEFLPSHQDPQIDKVTPDKIQVESDSNPETVKDTILSIQGDGFNVFRYSEEGEMKTNYPKVVLGGATEGTGEIIIEKKADGKVYYSTKDESGNFEEKPIEGAIFEVLDRNGNIVTGVGGNETGTSLVLTVPKGLKISTNNINKNLPVAVANPKRDSSERGIYTYKNDIISFVTVSSNPIIEEIDPYIVTVEGGEDITIKGRNFDDGIKVFIDGQEIPDVTREIDRESTRGILKFKAPPGREGTNIVQVMNPDGGSDTHEFIYVQTMRIDPRITSIAPPKGTKDTLIIIKGDNFLKPDQTTSSIEGMGIYKLIGSRIFLGNEDVNKYASKGLDEYVAPSINDEKLIDIVRDSMANKDRLQLSPYYKNATIKKGDNYYSISIDYEGNPVIVGKEESYTIKLVGDNIKAINSQGETLDVESRENELTIGKKKFDIEFDYKLFSIARNEVGTKSLRVADYYDSLILKNNGAYYTIDVNDAGRITMTDGKTNTYEIRLDDDNIVAIQGSSSQAVDVDNGSIKIGIEEDKEEFKFWTPFYQDPSTRVITGHRAKVKNKNEIWVTIPEKEIPGFYDVTVRNPDTKSFTVENGFEYLKPQSNPIINYISPSQGSVDGGYEITIYGEDFQNTTSVYIAGVKVPEQDVKVDKTNYKNITVTVPKYPGDVDVDFTTDKKFVLVTVLNEDGGSVGSDNLFAYVIASSRPRIEDINPVSGTAAGGDVVEIWGYDFRYYEPYKGAIPKEGDRNFDDLDKDGKWTRYRTDADVPDKFREPVAHKNFTKYIDSPVLPKIYFGKEQAKIVEFREGYIKVITPSSASLGATDVYLLNNDAGTSNKFRFTYEGSDPNIRDIRPNVGRKQGGENIDIEGSGFKSNTIDIINKDKTESSEDSFLVRFGDIGNSQIPREAENSGLINQGVATVNLDGGLKVEYKIVDGSTKLIVSLTEDKKTYTGKYSYTSGVKYIDIQGLKDEDGKNYAGHELIKVEVDDGRLLVTRGYSPSVKEKYTGHLEVVTPTYYSIGNVNVIVENPDGVSNQVVFQYRNPDSRPRITNITRDGQQPQLGDDGEIKILPVNIKGGSIITIEGSDFRDVELIQMGNVLKIEPRDLLIEESNKLVFKMPEVNESAVAYMHKVVVINEDGGTASSDEVSPPIYIEFIKGESNPEIESIDPPRGPASGGNTVLIKGKDFRQVMEGYEGGTFKVYFDGKQVPKGNVRFIDYKTISVVVPPGKPGSVEVKVENPDGEMSNTVEYTYASNPKITSVVDPLDPTEKATISTVSIEGGDEIKLKGTGFMEGATVYFAPKVTPLSEGEEGAGDLIYIEGRPYILEEGTEGTDFEFIDDETVTVKTPSLKAGSVGVIIVNPDDGASQIYTNLTYGIPEIAAPSGVVAELVYDRFIRVHWNEVSGASQYEIFVVIDDKTTELIGTTDLTSFAYSDLLPRTKYKFVVKAVGDFGSSKPSLESNTVRTGRVVGPPDEDGKLAENTSFTKVGNVANIVIGTKDRDSTPLVVDLTRGSLAGSEEVIISIPTSVIVRSGNRNVNVIGKDFSLNFKPSAFNIATVRENSNRYDAGVRFKVSPYNGNAQVVSGNQLSTVYNLDATVYVGNASTSIDYLNNSMNLTLDYDVQKANLRKLNNISFNYFNPSASNWQFVSFPTSVAGNSISGNVERLGKYAVVGNRR